MAAHKSTYRGMLIMPDGTEVRQGDSISIPAGLAKNAGVAGWLESGWLVPVAPPAMLGGKK